MRAVVQRCLDASVLVDGVVVGQLTGRGLVALVGVTHSDTEDTAARLADKIYDLRIFERPATRDTGPRELSAGDLGLPVLVVSQFTLYADTRKGRRPTWDAAAPRGVAAPMVEAVVHQLQERGATVASGRFGADMQLRLTNDGPMTIIIDCD